MLCNRFFKKPDENPNLLMDLKNLHRKPKVKDFCQMFVIAKMKSRSEKSIYKNYRLANGFYFFVNSTSGSTDFPL
jgi:hypothetical protein